MAVLAAILVVISGALWFSAVHQPAGLAPEFSLLSTGYENGTHGEQVPFALSDYRGNVVLLDMMAVACTACRGVTTHVLIPLQEAFANESFSIISIDTWADPASGQNFGGETVADLIALQKEENVTWRHAMDTDEVWRKYEAIALPKLILIDTEGRIILEANGFPEFAEFHAGIVAAIAGEQVDTNIVRLGLYGLAFVAGAAAFFAPCSIGLIPAYFAVLLGAGKKSANEILRAGTATAAGLVAIYAILAVVFWQVGPFLRPHLETFQVVVGFTLVAIGLLMFWPGAWEGIGRRLGMGRVDGRKGFFMFGIGYGLAAFGCTGPVFLPILFSAFVDGAAVGFTVFGLYALALIMLLAGSAALVARGQTAKLSAILRRSHLIARISASLLVLAGLYVLYFHYRATGSWI